VPGAREAPQYGVEARAGLEASLAAGARVLAAAGAALDAVVAAVEVLEDCPVFNAGRGSVLNAEGEVETDAALMDGHDRAAGAVAALRGFAHPVAVAREVLRDGRHVLLAGVGAAEFARGAGIPEVDPASLVTPFRRDQLARASGGSGAGTVGAVARDARGRLAAATSTGGMAGKRPGRVSDSALVGAGTWADDATCAVSATGHGEYFIRLAFARSVDAGLRHAGWELETACRRALADVADLGGSGGCIAVDRSGRVALPFDTPGMPRGLLRAGGDSRVAVHPGESLD
jgi:isoaspartyl peptidase/L-asparaginase-like protein (Ntn-hydrolase superfamily)